MYKNRKRRKTDSLLDNLEKSQVTKTFEDHDERQKSDKTTAKSYLKMVAMESGFRIHKNSPNELEVDQVLFVKKFSSLVQEGNIKNNVTKVMINLKDLCKELDHFKNALALTTTMEGCDVSRGNKQDSLIRLLLHVDELHKHISQFLIDKLAEITADEDQLNKINWGRAILQTLRFLDKSSTDSKIGEQLCDIIYSTNDDQVKIEIIYNLPSIVSEDEHCVCASELSKLVNDEKLLVITLETLTQLNLNHEVQGEVQERLLNYVHRAPPDFIPAIVKFLISTSVSDEVFNGLRTQLSLKNVGANNQAIVFKCIQDCMLAVKPLHTSWMKNIAAVKNVQHHKPLDILLLLIIYAIHTDDTKRHSVLNLIKNKIKNRVFTKALFSETVTSFTPVVMEYFGSLLKICTTLLKCADSIVVEMVGHLYSAMFEHLEYNNRCTIINGLLECIGATKSSSPVPVIAFKILKEITEEHLSLMKTFSRLFFILLDKLNELTLNEVRDVMDMLCIIAYSSDDSFRSDCERLQNEINLIVKKQFANLRPNVVSTAVVGMTMLVKHIGSAPKNQSNDFVSRSVEEVSLTNRAQEARAFVDLLLNRQPNSTTDLDSFGTVRNSPEILHLSLEQLAHMVMHSSSFDETLAHYMASVARKRLKEMYVVKNIEDSNYADISMMIQFSLNDESEGINIGPLAVKEAELTKHHTKGNLWPLRCLAPTLRLLQALERQDVSEIDALLSYGIVFPSLDIFSVAAFKDLNPFQQHVALNALFYAINWFRGVLSCFSSLIKKKKPEIVLKRLKTIIWLMEKLAQCLPLTMEYIPPPTYYLSSVVKMKPFGEKIQRKKGKSKKKKVNKKKAKPSDENSHSDDDVNGQCDDNDVEDRESDDEILSENESKSDLTVYQNSFIELDIDVWLLLTQPLVLTPSELKEGQFCDAFTSRELLFLLDDFVRKINYKLPSSNKKLMFLKPNSINYRLGFENIESYDEIVIAKNTVTVLGNLTTYLIKSVDFMKKVLRENDSIYDAPGLSSPVVLEVRECMHRILQIFSTLFGWKEFKNGNKVELMSEGIKKIYSRISEDKRTKHSMKHMIHKLHKYFLEFGPVILDIKSATTLITLMKTLHENVKGNHCPEIRKLSSLFLGRVWFSKGIQEQGVNLNKNVHFLLGNYIENAEDHLKALTEVINSLKDELAELPDSKEATLQTFPVFNRNNINWLLDGIIKGIESVIKTRVTGTVNDTLRFEMWTKVIDCLAVLVNIVKLHSNRLVLRVYIKGMTIILRLIKSNAISTFDYVLNEDPVVVSQTLKKMQCSTRYIQSVCTYTKMKKDTVLELYVPIVRELMDCIAFDTKHLFLKRGWTEALFLGSMKNKNIDGEEVKSQMDQSFQEDEEAEESSADRKGSRSESSSESEEEKEEEEEEENDDMEKENDEVEAGSDSDMF